MVLQALQRARGVALTHRLGELDMLAGGFFHVFRVPAEAVADGRHLVSDGRVGLVQEAVVGAVEQVRLIVECGSLREGLGKYGRT